MVGLHTLNTNVKHMVNQLKLFFKAWLGIGEYAPWKQCDQYHAVDGGMKSYACQRTRHHFGNHCDYKGFKWK